MNTYADNPQSNVQMTESCDSDSSDTETKSVDDYTQHNTDEIESSQFDACVAPADPAADPSEIISIEKRKTSASQHVKAWL